jgi:hypothetical protein
MTPCPPLRRHLAEVPRKEWGGLVTRSYDTRGRRYIKGSTQYPAPDTFAALVPHSGRLDEGERLAPIPTPLTQAGNQEAFTLLRECLRYVETRANASTATYFWHTMEGYEAPECTERYGTTKAAMYQRVRPLRHTLAAWAAA